MTSNAPIVGNFAPLNESWLHKVSRLIQKSVRPGSSQGTWGLSPLVIGVIGLILLGAIGTTTVVVVARHGQTKPVVTAKTSVAANKNSEGTISTASAAANTSKASKGSPAKSSSSGSNSVSTTGVKSATTGTSSASSGSKSPATSSKRIAVGIAVDDSNQVNNNQIANYTNAVGTSPNFVEWYQSWSEPLYYSSQETSVTSHHLIPVISWTSNSTPLTAISNGSQNATVDAAATLAKQWPGTLYIRFDYEMNITSSLWDPANLSETPANFVSAWQYVVNRFQADGVTNVKWVWSPNINCNGSCPFDSYYPGSNYVDMVGLDGYNYAWVDGVSWQTFASLFQNSYNSIVALAPGKPVDIAEVAAAEPNSSEVTAGDSKATWIQQMASYIPTNMPAVTAITWWSAASDQAALEINSSPGSVAAWQNSVIDNLTYQSSLP